MDAENKQCTDHGKTGKTPERVVFSRFIPLFHIGSLILSQTEFPDKKQQVGIGVRKRKHAGVRHTQGSCQQHQNDHRLACQQYGSERIPDKCTAGNISAVSQQMSELFHCYFRSGVFSAALSVSFMNDYTQTTAGVTTLNRS